MKSKNINSATVSFDNHKLFLEKERKRIFKQVKEHSLSNFVVEMILNVCAAWTLYEKNSITHDELRQVVSCAATILSVEFGFHNSISANSEPDRERANSRAFENCLRAFLSYSPAEDRIHLFLNSVIKAAFKPFFKEHDAELEELKDALIKRYNEANDKERSDCNYPNGSH